jgi:hypothetical protein
MTSITIALEIAKSTYQVHVEDAEGRTVTRRRLRHSQVRRFSRASQRAWWRSRPVGRRTIGGVCSGRWAMKCG